MGRDGGVIDLGEVPGWFFPEIRLVGPAGELVYLGAKHADRIKPGFPCRCFEAEPESAGSAKKVDKIYFVFKVKHIILLTPQ